MNEDNVDLSRFKEPKRTRPCKLDINKERNMTERKGGFLIFLFIITMIVGITVLGILYDDKGDIVAGHVE